MNSLIERGNSFPWIALLALVPLALMLVGICDQGLGQAAVFAALVYSLWLLGRGFYRCHFRRLASSLMFSLLILSVCYVCYLRFPGWFPFGWHNLMQLDAIYSSVAGGIDMSYYRVGLAYPYFGLLPLSLVSQALDVSPLNAFIIFNFLCFLVWFYVYLYYIDSRGVKGKSAMAVAIAFLYSGIGWLVYYLSAKALVCVVSMVKPDFALGAIEPRVSPVFNKFLYIDAMAVSLPSLALQYVFLQRATNMSLVLSGLFGVQCIVSYPLLGPVAIIVSAASGFLESKGRSFKAAITAAQVACLYLVLRVVSSDVDGSGIVFEDSLRRIAFNVRVALVVCCPFLALMAYRAYRLKSIRCVGVELVVFGASMAAFCTIRLPFEVQYKFLYGAMVIMGFTACLEIARLVEWVRAYSPWTVRGVLFVGYVVAVYHLGLGVPPLSASTKPNVEGGFFIETAESREMKETVRRKGLAGKKGLIVCNTDFPLSVMLRIPVYFKLRETAMVGYVMSYHDMNTVVKRLSESEFSARRVMCRAIVERGDLDLVMVLKERYGLDYVLVVSDAQSDWGVERRFEIERKDSPGAKLFYWIL